MNKLILKYFLPALLLLLLFILVLNNRTPFGKGNSDFAADRGKEITRIELTGGDKRLTLEKKGSEWFVNGKNEIRKSTLLFILRALKEIKIKSPVSDDLFSSEITEKGITPVKVKVFEKSKLIKSFLVYQTKSNIYGNIMKIREGSKPFIVSIPGYEDEIGSVFNLNEFYWQPFTVFNLLPSQISSVSVEHFSDISSSFTIVKSNRNFNLTGPDAPLTGWDTSRIIRYLSYFIRVPFESLADEISSEEQEEIESGKPLFVITLIKSDGTKSVLTLWERYLEDDGSEKKDSDRLWAKTSDSDKLLIMRYFDVDPILKKKLYFYAK